MLDSLSAPRDKDDRRAGPERRVAALDTLVSSILENGLPSDKGIRPQMLVTVDVETLHDALTTPSHTRRTGAPARLAGFGPIGPKLLAYLGCVSDLTPILTQGGELPQARVLNVDRTHRLATPRQRKAVIARQGGQCAGPGCSNTHLEVHHSTWWSKGGKTDLDDLAGYCKSCHLLIHRGLLVVKAKGKGLFEHSTSTGAPVRRRTRHGWNRDLALIRQIATSVRHQRHERHAWMNTDTG